MEVERFPHLGVVLMEFTEQEALELRAMLNSGDIVASAFYDRVPWIRELIHKTAADDYDHGTARREFYEKYGIGKWYEVDGRKVLKFDREES